MAAINSSDGENKTPIIVDENMMRLANSFHQHMKEEDILIEDGKKILSVATIKPLKEQLPKETEDTEDPSYLFQWEPDSNTSLTKEMRTSIEYQCGLKFIAECKQFKIVTEGMSIIFALLECIRIGFHGTVYLDGDPSALTTVYLVIDL
jgi:hypothetical protein